MGINVQGGPVRGKTAKPVMMPKIPNTQVSSDGSMLVSAIDGYLTFENNHFLVKTLLVINGDVDYSMGNLEHSGDILIYGDVCEGLVIRSTGSVEVRGMVESAHLRQFDPLVECLMRREFTCYYRARHHYWRPACGHPQCRGQTDWQRF